MEGIQRAKARGVPFGRRKVLTPPRITDLKARRREGVPMSTLMRDFRLSKATIYRYLGTARPDQPAAVDQFS